MTRPAFPIDAPFVSVHRFHRAAPRNPGAFTEYVLAADFDAAMAHWQLAFEYADHVSSVWIQRLKRDSQLLQDTLRELIEQTEALSNSTREHSILSLCEDAREVLGEVLRMPMPAPKSAVPTSPTGGDA